MHDKELTQDSSSGAKPRAKQYSKVISRGYQGAAGVTITGPDAEDIHVVRGDE